MRADALDNRFRSGPRVFLLIGFLLLSASALPKSASIQEVQRMSWSVW